MGRGIKKTSYTVFNHGLKWEIDCYYGHLKSPYTAEIELKRRSQKVPIPDFLEVLAEVTNYVRHKNKNLTTKGLPLN